jgi:hypothetical protein
MAFHGNKSWTEYQGGWERRGGGDCTHTVGVKVRAKNSGGKEGKAYC